MSKNGFRLKFMFWLDCAKADEEKLCEQIEVLKQKRLFSKTIRDGMRLICDLREGQTDVLFELFPWVKDSSQPPTVSPSELRLQEQIARLEKLLIAQGNVPIQSPLSAANRTQNPTTTSLVEITDTPSNVTSKTLTQNFMDSMKGLANGFFD
jgi:hypothetical protein